MPYANAEEFYDIFKICLDKVMKDEKLTQTLGSANMSVCLNISDLDAFITLECKGGVKSSFGPPTMDVDVTVSNNKEICNKFWQGKLNLMMAMAKGQVKAKGAITKMMKFLPKINPVYQIYRETLKETGRENMVIK